MFAKSMPALSIRQPWPHGIMFLGKGVENRAWRHPPKFRGRCLIHAGKTFDEAGLYFFVELGLSGFPGAPEYPRGGIVGVMDVVDVVDSYEKLNDEQSKWYAGPVVSNGHGEMVKNYGLVIANPRPLPFFEMPGQLGFFDVDTSNGIADAVRIADKLSNLYTPAEAMTWWYSPQRLLGKCHPVDMLVNGNAAELDRMLDQIDSGVFV